MAASNAGSGGRDGEGDAVGEGAGVGEAVGVGDGVGEAGSFEIRVAYGEAVGTGVPGTTATWLGSFGPVTREIAAAVKPKPTTSAPARPPAKTSVLRRLPSEELETVMAES